MKTSHCNALLIDAPVNRHFAQVHQSPEALAAAVGLYIETGLRRHNGVIVFATAPNLDRFNSHLAAAGINPADFEATGQLQLFDADEALGRMMNGDLPGWKEFRRLVGGALDKARVFDLTMTRAYGEMVNVLWRRGRARAAIRLEEYWNEIAKDYPFCLFCVYLQDSLEEKTCMDQIPEIGRTHGEILASPENDRFQEALDLASRDIYGVPLSQLIGDSSRVESPGEDRLPVGQRSMLWMIRNLPASSSKILETAKRYYAPRPQTQTLTPDSTVVLRPHPAD